MPASGIAGLYGNSTFSFLKATVGGFPFFLPGDLLDPGIEPGSSALQADYLPSERPGKPTSSLFVCIKPLSSQLQACTKGIVPERVF